MTPTPTNVARPLDYRHTSLRPTWSTIPDAVRRAVGEAAGAEVTIAAPPVSSGFTGAYAGRVTLARGRDVFVKAAGPGNDHVLGALAQEARVLPMLPDGVPAPQLIAAGEVHGWRYLVLEVIEGHLPGMPWTPQDLTAAHAACLTVAVHGDPVHAGLTDESFAAGIAQDRRIRDTTDRLCAGEFSPPAGAPAWLGRRGAELAMLCGTAEKLGGGSLVHGDLRPDNLIVNEVGGAVLLDWNWVCTGPAWIDFVGLLPLAAWQGLDADGWMDRSPLAAQADHDEVDAFLAAIAVYMLSSLDVPPPPGCTPQLRRHQRLMAQAFLTWLGHRRHWSA